MIITHPATASRIQSYLGDMPQALLITGAVGVGASTIALDIATQISKNVVKVLPEKDDQVDLEKGTITVAIIRRLYEQTRSKQTHTHAFVIDYAERMAPQAQNAFLKLLEEPNDNIVFILVTHEPQKLLPTIHSRVQTLEVLPITDAQSNELLDHLQIHDATKRAQLLYMANGLPAEIVRLVNDDEYFAKGAQLVRDARDLLQAAPYQKLLLAQKYKDDRPAALRLIDIAIRILKGHLATSQKSAQIKQLNSLVDAYEIIAANGNIRLQLARAVL
jgi:DNA polymerase III delta prime subunit